MQRILTEHAHLLQRSYSRSAGSGFRDSHEEVGTIMDTNHIHTELFDKIVNVKTGEEQWIHQGDSNLITIGFGYLVAALLKGDGTYGQAISFWAIGEGEGTSWDALTTSQRQAKSTFDRTILYDEIARSEVSVVFIDENNEVVTPGPTSRIEVRASFGPTVSGSIREFGIFGGNATSTLDSGLMIDHKAHSVISLNIDEGEEQIFVRALRISL